MYIDVYLFDNLFFMSLYPFGVKIIIVFSSVFFKESSEVP